ncbi:MAG: hypothetical protein KC543_14845, partial [Myxococcales bacterium]|nr:hypothetical protein [Myxococcales bacterium]
MRASSGLRRVMCAGLIVGAGLALGCADDAPRPEERPQFITDGGTEDAPDAGAEVSLDGGAPDASAEVSPDGGAPDAGAEASPDGGAPDAGAEASPYGGAPDAGIDVSPDGGTPHAAVADGAVHALHP